MMRPIFGLLSMAVLVVSSVGLGCTRARGPQLPRTFPVTGVVTFDEKPLASATVMFNPLDGQGHGSIALTDDAGRYKLTTFKPGDGVVPGDYRVAITKIVYPGSANESPLTASADPRNILPIRYANDLTSGLTATVEAKPDNTFDFALAK